MDLGMPDGIHEKTLSKTGKPRGRPRKTPEGGKSVLFRAISRWGALRTSCQSFLPGRGRQKKKPWNSVISGLYSPLRLKGDYSHSLLGIIFNGFCFINLIPHFFWLFDVSILSSPIRWAVIKLLSVVITGGSRVVVFSGGLQLHFTTKGREMQ